MPEVHTFGLNIVKTSTALAERVASTPFNSSRLNPLCDLIEHQLALIYLWIGVTLNKKIDIMKHHDIIWHIN